MPPGFGSVSLCKCEIKSLAVGQNVFYLLIATVSTDGSLRRGLGVTVVIEREVKSEIEKKKQASDRGNKMRCRALQKKVDMKRMTGK